MESSTISTKSAWSKNLQHVPHITQDKVEKWANETAKIPRSKQQKGYGNFIEGFIHEVESKYSSVDSITMTIQR